jgi:peptidoglycan-associated lipoprotein
MTKLFAVFIIAGILIAGCAQRKVVERQPEAAQQLHAKSQPMDEEQNKSTERITEQQVERVESKEVSSNPEEIAGLFSDIHFEFNNYDIRAESRPTLKAVADHLTKDFSLKVLIEGHCDERGTNEYNLALGDERAKATRDYLVSLGIPSARIDTMSYGEEKPVCTDQTEECWAKNRRGHFILLSR